ncbi:MAG: cobalamin B12-binding domain-containing protein, partial [Anaerolineae bacterium]|nr:cobalamin B12-binding domain-containing protein [Anaerolineae bacterium]
MKIDIVIVYVPRYKQGHETNFVPPVTGIYLAALTPPHHEVRVIHQQVEPVDLDTDADLIALSFFTGFADEAYRLASAFRARGKVVVAGGPHVTYSAEEALQYVDAVVTGEAESVWES